jgi:hypothetical protein
MPSERADPHEHYYCLRLKGAATRAACLTSPGCSQAWKGQRQANRRSGPYNRPGAQTSAEARAARAKRDTSVRVFRPGLDGSAGAQRPAWRSVKRITRPALTSRWRTTAQRSFPPRRKAIRVSGYDGASIVVPAGGRTPFSSGGRPVGGGPFYAPLPRRRPTRGVTLGACAPPPEEQHGRRRRSNPGGHLRREIHRG